MRSIMCSLCLSYQTSWVWLWIWTVELLVQAGLSTRVNQWWEGIPFLTSAIVIFCGVIYFVCLLVGYDSFAEVCFLPSDVISRFQGNLVFPYHDTNAIQLAKKFHFFTLLMWLLHTFSHQYIFLTHLNKYSVLCIFLVFGMLLLVSICISVSAVCNL